MGRRFKKRLSKKINDKLWEIEKAKLRRIRSPYAQDMYEHLRYNKPKSILINIIKLSCPLAVR